MGFAADFEPHSESDALASAPNVAGEDWHPDLSNSYRDAEQALRTLIELGLQANEGDGHALLALGATMGIVVERIEEHHRIVDLDSALHPWRSEASAIGQHIDYCRQLQRSSLETLTEMLHSASSCSAVAQAVVVTGMVMLQDWYGHGRLLCTILAPRNSELAS